MKPVILIAHKNNPDTANFGIGAKCTIRSNYCRAVIQAGGLPIVTALGDAEEYADLADGLLLPGGSCDVDPTRYGEENRKAFSCDVAMDEMEIALVKAFVKRQKPIFGICRGHQILNVALGGTLIQDLKDDCPTQLAHEAMYAEGKNTHPVCAVSDSLLCQLFGKEFHTNSHHHQAVKTCGEGLRITVTTKDGLAEAIEHEQLPIFSVQWHPERMIGEENLELPNMMPLFEHFIALCKK